MSKQSLTTSYSIEKRFEPFYSGGQVYVKRDGSLLFCTCGNAINVVESQSGRIAFSIGGSSLEETEVSFFAVNTEEDTLVVAHHNMLLKKWELMADKAFLSKTWKSGIRTPVVRMLFGYDEFSNVLVTGSSTGSVKVWNLPLQTCVQNIKVAQGLITCLQLQIRAKAKDPYILFFANELGKIWVWNLMTNSQKCTLDYHSSAVTSICLTDRWVYSCSRDMTVAVWDSDCLTLIRSIAVFEAVECMAVLPSMTSTSTVEEPATPSAAAVITGGEKCRLKVYDTTSGKCVGESATDFRSSIVQILPCEAFGQLVVVTADRNMYFVDTTPQLTVQKQLVGFNDEVLDAAFLNQDYVVCATNSPDIRIYELDAGSCQLVAGHSDIVLSVISPDWSSDVFASCSKDNTARIWKFGSLTDVYCLCVITGHTASVTSIKFSVLMPSFFVTGSEDCTFKVWDVHRLFDDRGAAVGGKNAATEPRPVLSRHTEVAHSKGITCLEISPNDKVIATGSTDKTVKLWRLDARYATTSAGIINVHKRFIWDVRFSPVDQVLAIASGDTTVKIFALEDLTCVKTFEGHNSAVLRLQFLPNGLQIVSSDTAGFMKLWNIKTNECMKTFDEHLGKVWALSCSKKAEGLLVTGASDSRLFVWKDTTESEQMEQEAKRLQLIEQEQVMKNLVEQKEYLKAVKYALKLGRPHALYNILNNIICAGAGGLDDMIGTLNNTELGTLLGYVVEWNTNSRTYYVAQYVLNTVLNVFLPEELLKLPTIKEVVRDLLPYTERHFERLSRYRSQLPLIDFLLAQSRLPELNSAVSSSAEP